MDSPALPAPKNLSILPALLDEVCQALRQKWKDYESYRGSVPKRVVLADLTVTNVIEGIITRLIIAKYMSWHYGARLGAIVADKRAVPESVRKLSEAFGCEFYICFTDTYHAVAKTFPNISAEVLPIVKDWPLAGPELRGKVSGITIDGLPVGDLIYDSYLRANGCPTVEKIDNPLLSSIGDAIIRHRMAGQLLEQLDVAAIASAHVVYNYFGMLVRMAVARGIPVTQDPAINPMTMGVLTHFSNARRPLGQYTPLEFEAVWREEREEAIAFARDFMYARRAGLKGLYRNEHLYGAYAKGRRAYTRADLCERLGWDPAKPIVCIMTHVFVESPHAQPSEVHEDVYEWLEHTLQIAARSPEVQWLVKTHPEQEFYDQPTRGNPLAVEGGDVVRRLLAAYPAPQVAHCPDDLHGACLYDIAKAVITRFGTCGYEYPAEGVPAIAAGRGTYSNLGFTIEPTDRREYEEILRRIDSIEPPDEEQRQRAMVYTYMLLKKTRIASSLLPEFDFGTSRIPEEEKLYDLLIGMRERLRKFQPYMDPLNLAMKTMLRTDATSLNLKPF